MGARLLLFILRSCITEYFANLIILLNDDYFLKARINARALAEANRWTALWQFSEPKRRTLFARTEERGMGMATFSWACCHEADRCEAAAHAMHEDEAPKEVIMTVLQQREEALRQGRYIYSLAVSLLFSLFRARSLSRSRSLVYLSLSLSLAFSLSHPSTRSLFFLLSLLIWQRDATSNVRGVNRNDSRC